MVKRFTSYEEIENLCEAAVKDFFKRKHYTNSCCVEIEGFVTDYLGLPIVYEKMREPDMGRIGYLSDGERPIWVYRGGKTIQVLFPANVIVIDDSMQQTKEIGRKRFTIAHEAGHFILERHVPAQTHAAFHSEFDVEMNYSTDMMREMMSMNEAFANRAAGYLLMPRFLVERTLKKYNDSKKLITYDGYVMPQETKLLIQSMADSLGVNYTPCFMRLKELDLFDAHPIEEYLGSKLCFGSTEEM